MILKRWFAGLRPTIPVFCLLAVCKVSVYLFTLVLLHLVGLQPNINMFSSWDAGFYIGTAQRGYYSLETFNFPPLFSFLIRGFNIVTGNFVLAGLVVSNLFSLLQIIPAYKLFRHYSKRPTDNLILWLLFPLYFVWGLVPYSEPLFSFLVLSTWWALKQRRRIPAIVLATLAGLTRQPGILLFIPLILYFVFEERRALSKVVYSIASLLVPIGTLAWYLYAGWLTGNPLVVQYARTQFGTYFATELIRKMDIKLLVESYSTYTYPNHVAMPFLLAFVLLACLLLVPKIYRMDKYLSVYVILSIGLFMITLPLASTLRFVSTLFPLFLVMGFRPTLKLYIPVCILSSSLMLFAFMQMIFIG